LVKAIRVAVTGFGGLNNPEPGTPVARSLRQGWPGKLHIHAMGYDTWMTGGWMPGVVDELHLLCPLAEGDEAVLQRLMGIHKKSRFDVLIPCLDLEVPVFARLSGRLAKAGIKTLLPEQEAIAKVNKAALSIFCSRNDIPSPKTIYVPEVANVPFYADQLGYPLMVKGSVAGATKVARRDEAHDAAIKLNAKWGGGVILQEALEGEEYVVAMVARRDGSCLGSTPVRKIGINEHGKAVVGAVVDDPTLDRESQRILSQLGWRGPLELEFLRPNNSIRFNLIEINCRFPSWILLSHFAQSNLPVAYLKEIISPGKRRPPKPRCGTVFVRDVQDNTVRVDEFERLNRFLSMPVNGNFDGNGSLKPSETKKYNGGQDKLCVAVTGPSAFEVVLPGLGVAKSLLSVPEVSEIVALGRDPYDTGMYRRGLFDRAERLPQWDNSDELLDWFKNLQRRNPIDVVIPCIDFEVMGCVEIASELAEIGIKTLLPSASAMKKRSKEKLPEIVRKLNLAGLEVPKSQVLRTEIAVKRATKTLGLPFALKCEIAATEIIYSEDQAVQVWRKWRDRGEDIPIAQQFIAGDEFAGAGVCSRHHHFNCTVSIKKLKRCDRGNTWGATTADLSDLMVDLGRLLKKIKWVGPFEVEYIRDITREKFYLLEINPRFPAWINFTAEMGTNLPRDVIRLMCNETAQEKTLESDLIFTRSCEEISVTTLSLANFATKGYIEHV